MHFQISIKPIFRGNKIQELREKIKEKNICGNYQEVERPKSNKILDKIIWALVVM
jgi:hypothetical protein